MTTALKETSSNRYRAEFETVQSRISAGQNDRLRQLRMDAIDRFDEIGFPTVRQEEWRFTNVTSIARTDYALNPGVSDLSVESLDRYRYSDCVQLVIDNGNYVPELSELSGLPDGVTPRPHHIENWPVR